MRLCERVDVTGVHSDCGAVLPVSKAFCNRCGPKQVSLKRKQKELRSEVICFRTVCVRARVCAHHLTVSTGSDRLRFAVQRRTVRRKARAARMGPGALQRFGVAAGVATDVRITANVWPVSSWL